MNVKWTVKGNYKDQVSEQKVELDIFLYRNRFEYFISWENY